MLVRSPNGTYEDIDFRETAPAAAFQDMYNNNTVMLVPTPYIGCQLIKFSLLE